MKTGKITNIEQLPYDGVVYNIELVSNHPTDDDLYWVCNGIIVHNCFPKDINAMISVAHSIGVSPTVLEAAWKKNLEVRSEEERDWEQQVGRAVSRKGKRRYE